jgi:hypothetical protein
MNSILGINGNLKQPSLQDAFLGKSLSVDHHWQGGFFSGICGFAFGVTW